MSAPKPASRPSSRSSERPSAKGAPPGERKIVSQNRRARYDYFIGSTFEAGVVLQGSEVKALRGGQGSVVEAYASVEEGEVFLNNAFIPEYTKASMFTHEPRRPRKLLLHNREIRKLFGLIRRRGKTLVPLSLYFTPRGKLKVELGIAEGKKKVDKRAALKEKDWKLQKSRLMKNSSF